ncbi:MAG: hypothetical protein F6J93_23195 [Oscillatoria sp. SIO1A7]|nr:hypothetical protein [Oscillatoria sp. SIO1A7]
MKNRILMAMSREWRIGEGCGVLGVGCGVWGVGCGVKGSSPESNSQFPIPDKIR